MTTRLGMTWAVVCMALAAAACNSQTDTDVAADAPAGGVDAAGTNSNSSDSFQEPPPEQPRETVPAETGASAAAAATVPTSTVSGEAGTSAITLQPAEWSGIEAAIAERKGKVVVVDLWATYCAPCRVEFPGLVALSKSDPENIACVSVSLDEPEKQAEALAFLQEQQATLPNFLCTTDPDKLYDEILKIGGVPAVYVYGRDGNLARLFTGPAEDGESFRYDAHIAPFVKELAAQ